MDSVAIPGNSRSYSDFIPDYLARHFRRVAREQRRRRRILANLAGFRADGGTTNYKSRGSVDTSSSCSEHLNSELVLNHCGFALINLACSHARLGFTNSVSLSGSDNFVSGDGIRVLFSCCSMDP